MLLRRPIQKTKHFFRKTLQNLNALLFGEYQKLPQIPPCNSFSCICGKTLKKHQLDHLYAEFSDQWESDQDREERGKMEAVVPSKELVNGDDRKQSSENNTHGEKGDEEIKNMGYAYQGRRVQSSFFLSADRGSFALLQKMKELKMMDASDVDHVLDIEEVLHCYSLLTSPIYLDIVDTFFMDMHHELFLPRVPSLPRSSSVRINNSSRRLGPLKL